MPKMNGCEVLKNLRKEHPSAKILVLTGSPIPEEGALLSGDSEAKRDALKLADDVINKPFDIEHVLCRIRELGA